MKSKSKVKAVDSREWGGVVGGMVGRLFGGVLCYGRGLVGWGVDVWWGVLGESWAGRGTSMGLSGGSWELGLTLIRNGLWSCHRNLP